MAPLPNRPKKPSKGTFSNLPPVIASKTMFKTIPPASAFVNHPKKTFEELTSPPAPVPDIATLRVLAAGPSRALQKDGTLLYRVLLQSASGELFAGEGYNAAVTLDAPSSYSWKTEPQRFNADTTFLTATLDMTINRYGETSTSFLKPPDILNLPGSQLSKIMKREIQTCEMLRQNSHPNICAYLGVRCVGPHVIGLSFDRYKHTLTSLVYSRMEFDARHALQNITSGLMHLHRLGYVHCDIKPDNIFVNDIASHFVIGDFDSCHKRGKPLNAKTGTPRWMNAKLKTSKPADPADSTMDWWSLNLVKIWMQTKGITPSQTPAVLEAASKRLQTLLDEGTWSGLGLVGDVDPMHPS